MVWKRWWAAAASALLLLISAAALLLLPNSSPFAAFWWSSHQSNLQVSAASGLKLHNVAFGIAAGSDVWQWRKEYIKAWWRPKSMRGFVWLDRNVSTNGSLEDTSSLPPLVVSEDTSRFRYTFAGPAHQREQKQQIRMSRIVSEMFRLGLPDVHWFVMGDDDTVFFPENLVQVLSKYDHSKLYYIGCPSESHLQNVQGFSTGMAYGGAGFAISYTLARELHPMQDGCIQRHHFLYSGDARIHACMAELGVPLTLEPGFHQLDIHGDASGLLGAHPAAPLVSLHHIDRIEPLFPGMDRVQALQHLSKASRVDQAGTLQQSICYSMEQSWSVKVSWGYVVQIMRGLVSPRDLEVPQRSFIGWHDDRSELGYRFKTYAVPDDPCQRFSVFFMANVTTQLAAIGSSSRRSEDAAFVSSSVYRRSEDAECRRTDALAKIKWINVTKERTQISWYKIPRRQCCRIVNLTEGKLHLHVRDCRSGELSTIS